MSGSAPDDEGPDLVERVRLGLARIVDASARERIALSVAAFVVSILIGGVIVFGAGLVATCSKPFVTVPGLGTACYNPVDVYYFLFFAPLLSSFNLALTAKGTTLLLFTGLSVAVAFRAGLFNIGTQGQFVLGALATALGLVWIGPHVPGGLGGALLLVPAGLLLGAIVGGFYGAIPGALKAYADANEVITTIMLNFVAADLAFYLVNNHFGDPKSQSVETKTIPDAAQLNPVLSMFGGAPFSLLAIGFAVALLVAIYVTLTRTSFGYELRTSGLQPAAADYAGVDAERMVVTSMTLSGAIGGLGGAVWVMMVLGRWRSAIPPLGFDGITVSILAGNNPLGVLPAALLFGVMKAGSLTIEFQTGVPKQLVGVLRGLVILFIAMPEFFRMLGARAGVTESDRAVAADGGETDE